VVRGGPLRLANANQWLPQFTRANCGGNGGYVLLGHALGGGGIVLPRRVHHDNLPGFTRLHSGRRAVERK
jgi:hypothetical protein